MQRRSLVSAVLAAGLLVAAAGCADGDADTKSGSGAAASTLKIGFLGSLTGTYQAVGTDLKSGFELYLSMHDNKLGGHPIDLKIADEGDGAPTALPAATKLIKDEKVVALTGIVGGGSVAAVAPLLAEAKIPLIGSNGRPELKDLSGVWTTSFMSTDAGQAIAQYIKDKVNGPVFAIGPEYQGGFDQVGGFTTEFTKIGGQLVNGKATWTPFPATTNFLPYLSQIKQSGAKAVYTFYAGKAAIDFVKQYAQSDAKDIPLYAAGFLTEGSVLQAQGDAARNILNVCNYSPDLDNEENRKFVAAWKQKHPDATPTEYAMASYDAAAVLDRAIAAAGDNPTPESINAAVAKLGQIASPRGNWQFGPKNHSPIQKWYLRQVRNDGRALANVMVQDLATVGA
ncbi:ABC transporter substrate-binding protein [Dactylosporangium sp. NPDC049742]|uniref:ABC transporter substrate-binding protein n=1 Tax=Dactylosporangium sp. NPDC049742 TaxID=3154737 RepID=UPI003435B1B9